MLVEQQVAEEGDAEVHGEEVSAGNTAEGDATTAHKEVPTADAEPSSPSSTPPTPLPQPSHDIHSTSQGRMIAEMDQDSDVVLEDDEEVAYKAKELITEVVTAASKTITAASINITVAEAQVLVVTLTFTPARVATAPSRRRKRVTKAQARKNMMIYLKKVVGFKMNYFEGMSYDDIRPIFERYFDSNMAFLQKTKEQIKEEESKALKRFNETPAEKAAKRQKLDEDVEELKEDLEALWCLVKERFCTTKPKNFFDDFLLMTFGAIFEKPDIDAQVWKNQRSVYGPAKVKGWKLLKSCGVKIITFTTIQLILLVKRKYPLTRFTLDQMLNAVRLKVEEESEISLELLSFGVDVAKELKKNMLSV
nr:hypothetical protein [Tanacetum cinerariifolium]